MFEVFDLVADDLLLPAPDTTARARAEGPVLDGVLQFLDDSSIR
jgi:hypothetical protein